MAVADGAGLPLAVYATSASPHEVKLVGTTIEHRLIQEKPEKLIGDKAYDSDPLNEELVQLGIELIVAHKRNRKKAKTQDGRQLRRYKRRWKVERLFAWMHNCRRVVVRYEYYLDNFLGFVHLACVLILLKSYL